MKILVCDRCGARGDDVLVREAVTISILYDNQTEDLDERDLCDNCLNALKALFQEGSNDR
jgi:hypothetical protein